MSPTTQTLAPVSAAGGPKLNRSTGLCRVPAGAAIA